MQVGQLYSCKWTSSPYSKIERGWDDTEGWIKLLRQDNNKHIYFHEDIHRPMLNKLGYKRRQP